jgi:hypothetical protein
MDDGAAPCNAAVLHEHRSARLKGDSAYHRAFLSHEHALAGHEERTARALCHRAKESSFAQRDIGCAEVECATIEQSGAIFDSRVNQCQVDVEYGQRATVRGEMVC